MGAKAPVNLYTLPLYLKTIPSVGTIAFTPPMASSFSICNFSFLSLWFTILVYEKRLTSISYKNLNPTKTRSYLDRGTVSLSDRGTESLRGISFS